MRLARRAVLVCLVLAWPAHRLAAQAPAPPDVSALTDQDIEAFLLNARIVSTKSTNAGITSTLRATLSDGRLTHDAHIQSVDVAKPIMQTLQGTEINFKDTYRYNIAAYHLARLLHVDHVPVSVARRVEGKDAAVTWWVDDVKMDEQARTKLKNKMGPIPEETAKQLLIMRVFDELIQNTDRNTGNLLWTSDWTMWMIDHTRAFRFGLKLQHPNALERCDGVLLREMRLLTPESVAAAVGNSLTKEEIRALLTRRDLLVRHFDQRSAQRGRTAVFYAYLD